MTRSRRSLVSLPSWTRLLTLCLACVGCRGEHHHEDSGRVDNSTTGTDDLPGQAVTVWTARTELFMEYQPLLVGEERSFAAHVTELPSFKPLTAGQLTLTVKMRDGSAQAGRADQASSPGIFRPLVKPESAGPCEMVVTIVSPTLNGELRIGDCQVFSDVQAATAGLAKEQEGAGRITFLKEQQWKTEFATAAVEERELQAAVDAHGEIRAASGREAHLTAAVAGRVVIAEPPPTLGSAVKRGQRLASIAARLSSGGDRASLEAELKAARLELDAAEKQLQRAERLFAEEAVPFRQVEEARNRVSINRARWTGASGRLEQFNLGAAGLGGPSRGAFQVPSPIDGTLVSVEVTSGEFVEEGQTLFRVVDLSRVWLVARVFEPDIPKVEGARSAWFLIDGYSEPFILDESNGKLITVGHVLDPKTRTVPVIFEVENRAGHFRIGQFARVSIASGARRPVIAIPTSAVIDEGGKATAYVMVEGEAFERRILKLGMRSAGHVQVLDGIQAGEHVVTRGGYEIKLASASGAIPAHGHAH